MHIPIGVAGWTVFATGLLIVGYRIHGIDAPRPWIEGLERHFTYAMHIRLLGAGLLIAALACGWFGKPAGLLRGAFFGSLTVLAVFGLLLLLYQNHARHMVIATAESSDGKIRINAIIYTIVGLLLALAPFFI